MIRRFWRPLTPEEIRERNTARNIERIMHPRRRPSMYQRVRCIPLRVQSWWWKRRHPEFMQLLASARLDLDALRQHHDIDALPAYHDDCGGPA